MSLIDTVSGVAGACACTYTGLPFDVAKVRLQSGRFQYRGPVDCLLSVSRTEGLMAWWRGAGPALSSSIAENMTGVTIQRAIQRKLLAAEAKDGARLSMRTEVAVGAATGVCTCVVMNPFEVVKTRLQVSNQSRDVLAEIGSILRGDGPMGMFRGLTALWARDIPFNALFFGSYESITTLMMRSSGASSRDELSSVQVCLAGGVAGVIGWTFVLPFDTIKTRMQAATAAPGAAGGPQSVHGAVLHLVARDGVRALYHGWSAAVLRAFPANAAMFLGVEMTQRVLKRYLAPDGASDAHR